MKDHNDQFKFLDVAEAVEESLLYLDNLVRKGVYVDIAHELLPIAIRCARNAQGLLDCSFDMAKAAEEKRANK